jgi:hypothetical protein
VCVCVCVCVCGFLKFEAKFLHPRTFAVFSLILSAIPRSTRKTHALRWPSLPLAASSSPVRPCMSASRAPCKVQSRLVCVLRRRCVTQVRAWPRASARVHPARTRRRHQRDRVWTALVHWGSGKECRGERRFVCVTEAASLAMLSECLLFL